MRKTFSIQTIQLFVGLAGLLLVISLFGDNVYANDLREPSINCQTAFGEKSFTIQENTVAFHDKNATGRSLSSVMNAIEQNTHTGFKKTIYINGNKHLINIQNKKHFSDSDDYLAITSPRGHKMTYPLTCKYML